MSKQYPGGIISKTPVTPSGPYSNDTASGIWTLDQQAYWAKLGQWPTAGNNPIDPQFNYVTMLLHGDGTNGAQNNTFLDSSTNNFTITRNGNTTQGSFSPYGSNWSNYFDGTIDYLTISTGTALNLNTGDFTIEGWIYPISTSNYFTLFSNGDYPSTSQIIFVVDGTNTLNLYMSNGSGWSVSLASSIPISLNTWTHIAATASGTTYTVWVNGVSGGSSTVSFTRTSPNATSLIGRLYPSTNNYYAKGYISNVRVVKGTALYTTTFTPSTTPLTAVSGTSLLTCQSNRFIDNSTNALTIISGGAPSVQRFNPFGASTAYSTSVIGGSGYFNGSSDYLSVPDDVQFTLTTSDYTMEMWVYPTSFASLSASFSYGWSTAGGTRLIVFLQNTNGTYQIYYNDASNTFVTTNTVKLNSWNHLALVRNGSNFNFYINGVSGASATNSFSYPDSSFPQIIGGSWNGSSGTYFYQGYISDVRICVGAAVYTSNFTPPTAPLTTANTPALLCNFTNGAIFDNAMMNDLETVGNAQISTSVVKYGTGSLAFDGTGDWLLGQTGSLNFNFGTGDFTIELWVYATSVSTNAWLIDFFNSTYTGLPFNLYIDNPPKFTFASNGADRIASTTSVTINTWYHVAVCRSGTSTKLFINGTQEGSTYTDTYNYTVPSASQSIIGARGNYGYPLFGYIDDLRITKGYARYTANFTPPTAAFFNYGPT